MRFFADATPSSRARYARRQGAFVQVSFSRAEKKWRQPRATRCVVSGIRPRNRTACAAIVVRSASPAAGATARRRRRAAAASLHDEARAAIATSTSKHWLLPAVSGELGFALTSSFWLRRQVPREPAPVAVIRRQRRERLTRAPKASCGRDAICRDDVFSPERCEFTVRDC